MVGWLGPGQVATAAVDDDYTDHTKSRRPCLALVLSDLWVLPLFLSIFYRMVLEPWLGWGSCDNRRSTCSWAGHSHFSSSLHADQPPSALATINCSKRRHWWHLRAALIDGYGDSKLESRLLTHPLERMITVGSTPGVYEIYNWSHLFPPVEQKTLSCPHSVLATIALGLSYHTAHCCSSHSSDGEVSCLCPPSPRPGAM